MVQTHPWLLNPQWKCPSSKCPWGTWGEKQQDFLNSSVRFFSTTKRKRNKSSQEGRCQWVFWQVGRAKFAISVVAVCYSLFIGLPRLHKLLPASWLLQAQTSCPARSWGLAYQESAETKHWKQVTTKCLSERCSLRYKTSRFFLWFLTVDQTHILEQCDTSCHMDGLTGQCCKL